LATWGPAALKLCWRRYRQRRQTVRENRPDRHRCDIQPSPRQQRGSWALSGKTAFKIGDEITVGGPGTCAFMPRRRADA